MRNAAETPPEIIPPRSLNAEQSVLGGIIMFRDCWDDVALILQEKDFYLWQHRLIWQSLREMIETGENEDVNLISLSTFMEVRKDNLPEDRLTRVGGFAYLAQITKCCYAHSTVTLAREVARLSHLRHLMNTGISLVSVASDTAANPDDVISSIIPRLEQGSLLQDNPGHRAADLLDETFTAIAQQCDRGGLSGVSTGLPELDTETSGLQPGDLVVLAARPSIGKTAFMLNLVTSGLETTDQPVFVFSLEMPKQQLMTRLLSALSSVPLGRIRNGTLTDEHWQQLTGTGAIWLKEQAGTRLIIDDTGGLSPGEMRSRARRYVRQYGQPAQIAVDYLQLMQVPEFRDNRTQEITEISRSLKALAKEMNCPVVALSQLNRRLEQRPDKRPMLSDLRESGAIEQDADLIMFLFREEHYATAGESPLHHEKGRTEVIIGKQRNGPVGTVLAKFEPDYVRFVSYQPQYY